MRKRLKEDITTYLHRGTFVDDHTFVDSDGNVIDLKKTVMDDDIPKPIDGPKKPVDLEKPGRWLRDREHEEEAPREPIIKIAPDPTKTYIDDKTGYVYMWNLRDAKFVRIK